MDPQTQRFVEMQSEIQALRDELHRQRTAFMITAGAGHNSSQHEESQDIKNLETKLQNAQSESDHYKKLVKEAFTRFKILSKNDNQVTNRKLVDEWLIMFESVSPAQLFEFKKILKSY